MSSPCCRRATILGKAPVTYVPYLTGKRLLTTQAFRDLFRSEVIRTSEGISVGHRAPLHRSQGLDGAL